jgi:membrane-anchored protein YejM (alkaline phosphatase superfamily)
VHYTDGLIGDLLARLEAAGILDSTIVVITGDHGEEFNDNGAGYWGHTGNFTGYQTRVPLIVYLPGQAPGVVDAVTAHIDLPATLLVAGLGCAEDVAAYSNGLNLFGPLPAERAIVVASYVNHALVFGEDVFVVNPLRVQGYKLWDIEAETATLHPDLARQAMLEMGRFYQTEPAAATEPVR